MTAGRPKLPPRRQVILRIDEALLVETYALNPTLLSIDGGTRYGEMNKYFTRLLIEDNAKKKAQIKGKKSA